MDTVYTKADYRFPRVDFDGDGNCSFTCDTIGIAGTTPIFIRRTPTGRSNWPWKYSARMGFALFGHMCDPEAPGKNPFDDDWWDNCVIGVHCRSAEDAVKKMIEQLMSIKESLWAA
jgi:hypothetical protein